MTGLDQEMKQYTTQAMVRSLTSCLGPREQH